MGRRSPEPRANSREPTGCVISRLSASGPRRASLWRRLRPRENAATRLRGARACLALLAAAALLALAAPAQAQTEVWTATLTPADLTAGTLGCSNNIATARCSSTTFLSEDSFNHDSTDYNITGLFVRSSGRFEFLVNADLTTATAALTLVVGSTSLVLADADIITARKRVWFNTGASLTAGTDITVKLTAPGTPNAAPTAADNTVTAVAGTAYAFTADDFGFVDTDTGDTLASVKIVTLPAVGTLAFDGTPVMQNDVVIWDDIEDDKLTFTPVAGASGTGYATFTFKVNDGTVDSASAYTMTIDVTDAPSLACAAPNLAGRERIWTGTVTVGPRVVGVTLTGHGFSTRYSVGSSLLPDRAFSIGSNDYAFIGIMALTIGDLRVRTDTVAGLTAAHRAALRLHVCDVDYDFSAASVSGRNYTWTESLDWSSYRTRTLHLSLPEGYPEPPALPPRTPTGLSAQSVSGKTGISPPVVDTGTGAGRQLGAHPHRLRGPLPQDGRTELVAELVVPQLRDPGIRLPVNDARGCAGRKRRTADLLPRPEHRVPGPGARDQLLQ